ncbi:Septal ring factor EnvC, activator of murein hydrolases AmiA and AmiB [Kushneria avicenniae]|uniref:Septal ring factor EnvC, activator of murein hydrolases AmiA and AmiB n=1 Tax=Kushneria avicenniae TaxID=402385 RepID=A0A1I1JCX6_9GAMM|nr:peptidoglycan DD-metalloendopeptidase family protein [Kushneria avicenniae]SFC46404.1 Septal ring factor EnvC, activator of murein hydrolases AmiA and AmiB [Kushneria avicenniae]
MSFTLHRPAGRFWLLALTLGLAVPAGAASLDASKAELDNIRQNIEQTQRQLERTDARRGSAREELEQAEKALADTHRRLDTLEQARSQTSEALRTLDQRQKTLTDQRDAQQQALAEQVRALYKLGEQPRLKLLLDNQDPGEIDRFQHYLNRLNEARAEQLARLASLNEELENNRAQTLEQQQTLNQLQDELKSRQQTLAEQRQEREKALAGLEARYQSGRSDLEGLQADRAEAETMVSRLEQELARAREQRQAREKAERERRAREQARQAQAQGERSQQSPPPQTPSQEDGLTSDEMNATADNARSVPTRRADPAAERAESHASVTHQADRRAGSSKWPVNGSVIASYGSGDGLNKNGVLIAAPAGTPIYAASGGQVVFADWMRGFGYLVIIDHGGILSLYAHQQRLAVASGDRVERGATLGYVGDTGGLSRPALYFEVRRGGKAINPQSWLASR